MINQRKKSLIIVNSILTIEPLCTEYSVCHLLSWLGFVNTNLCNYLLKEKAYFNPFILANSSTCHFHLWPIL